MRLLIDVRSASLLANRQARADPSPKYLLPGVREYPCYGRRECGAQISSLWEAPVWRLNRSAAVLVTIGCRGLLSPEIGRDPNDSDKLRKVSASLDRILSLA